MENEKQTRVEKYKKLRQEIDEMDVSRVENPYQVQDDSLNDVGLSNDELQQEHVKKNTLSISIDQIVKAHDEYTTMIAQDELDKQRKETNKIKLRKMLSWLGVIGGILLFVVILIVLIISLTSGN